MVKDTPDFIKNLINYNHKNIDYTKQKNISYSQYSTFSSCAHRWKLIYKDKNKKQDFNINLVFGTAIHETIQEIIKNLYTFKTQKSALELDYINFFYNRLKEIYKESLAKNNNIHFTDKATLEEYYNDGVEIIKYFIKNYKEYFSPSEEILIGIEYPIFMDLNFNDGLIFNAYLDLFSYNLKTNKFRIIDFKTSKGSWRDYQKKDKTKLAQLLLYKYFIHRLHNIPLEDIEVEFIILKRKLLEDCDFKQKRLQSFIPAQKSTIKPTVLDFSEFLKTSYDENGNYSTVEHKPNPSKWNCGFCQFKDDIEKCKFAHKE